MDLKEGEWLLVKYVEEKFLDKENFYKHLCEIQLCIRKVKVCCLQMNYGIWDWQEFECKEDVIFCKQVFQTNEQPKMLKKGRKWLWPY